MSETIKTIKSSGGDYTSFSGFISGEAGALSTDEVRVGEVYYDVSDSWTLSGFTNVTSTSYVEFRAASGQECDGTTSSTAGCHNTTGGTIASIQQNYTHIKALYFYKTGKGRVIDITFSYNNLVIDRCFFETYDQFTNDAALYFGASSLLVTRSIFSCRSAATNKWAILALSAASGCSFYQCTVNGGANINSSSSNMLFTNCVAADHSAGSSNTWSYSSGSIHASSTNNAGMDGSSTTPPGSNPITSDLSATAGVDFGDIASWDFSIDSGSTLYQAGSDISGTVDNDIAGNALSAPYPIGAFDSASVAYTLAIGIGSYSVAGQAVTLTKDAPLAIGIGSFSVAGQDVSLIKGYPLAIGIGSYSFNGQDVTLIYSGAGGYTLAIGTGTFSVNGQAVSLVKGYPLVVATGSYAINGQAVSLIKDYPLAIGTGAYSVNGQDVTLTAGYVLSAGLGSYTLTGNDVGLIVGHVLSALTGSYIVSGQAVALNYGYTLYSEAGTFTVNGQAVTLTASVVPVFGTLDDYVLIIEVQASGTDAGGSSAGEQVRVLNSEVTDAGAHASLATNQITLESGTYRFSVSAPCYKGDSHKVSLKNVSDSTYYNGTTEEAPGVIACQNRSYAQGRFTIDASKVFEVVHEIETAIATNGLGIAASFTSKSEKYTIAEFWKEA